MRLKKWASLIKIKSNRNLKKTSDFYAFISSYVACHLGVHTESFSGLSLLYILVIDLKNGLPGSANQKCYTDNLNRFRPIDNFRGYAALVNTN